MPPSSESRHVGNAALDRRAPTFATSTLRLQRLLTDELLADEDDLEDMIADILAVEPDKIDDMPSADTLSELDLALNQTRLDAAGGNAEALLTLKNIHAMIDEAAARDAIHPAMLMVLGRSFAAAQVEIGDAAREAMGRALDLGGPRLPRKKLTGRFCSRCCRPADPGRSSSTKRSAPQSRYSLSITRRRSSSASPPIRIRWRGGPQSVSSSIARSSSPWPPSAGSAPCAASSMMIAIVGSRQFVPGLRPPGDARSTRRSHPRAASLEDQPRTSSRRSPGSAMGRA